MLGVLPVECSCLVQSALLLVPSSRAGCMPLYGQGLPLVILHTSGAEAEHSTKASWLHGVCLHPPTPQVLPLAAGFTR